ncbi:MAG: DUF2130 domain-containing protein [Bacilli bacterium]|nr:DUF2130 domain-containing protein [Bacilli bacterium]
MKKIKVIVKDESTLELAEAGAIGDIINLKELQEIDTATILHAIAEGRDNLYREKLAEAQRNFEGQKQAAIIQAVATEKASLVAKQQEVDKAKNELAVFRASVQADIQKAEINKEKELTLVINTLKEKVQMAEVEQAKQHNEDEKIKIGELDKQKAVYEQQKQALNDELLKAKEEISKITFQKSVKNVKQTGEDLEAWCNNEMKSYLQNGFENCTWTKDNDVVKDEGDSKGSKADFIFKVYASSAKQDKELLASVCMDMKDENPESTNKRTNESYFKALDNNRTKKHCKYAVLVSNLELDKPNDTPISKVFEYPDMYVVRPGAMVTFLNMVVSLSKIYSSLLLAEEKQQLELKDSTELVELFESLKESYLDKPLEGLQKEVENIQKQSAAIHGAVNNIDSECDNIIVKYIKNIEAKLEKFNIKKLTKGLDKLD